MSVWSNYLVADVLQQHFTSHNDFYLALHTVDPTNLGLASTELSGGSYSRQKIIFTTPSNRSVTNSAAITFLNLPVGHITYLAVWKLVAANPATQIITSIAVAPFSTTSIGNNLYIPVGDIAITVD